MPDNYGMKMPAERRGSEYGNTHRQEQPSYQSQDIRPESPSDGTVNNIIALFNAPLTIYWHRLSVHNSIHYSIMWDALHFFIVI